MNKIFIKIDLTMSPEETNFLIALAQKNDSRNTKWYYETYDSEGCVEWEVCLICNQPFYEFKYKHGMKHIKEHNLKAFI